MPPTSSPKMRASAVSAGYFVADAIAGAPSAVGMLDVAVRFYRKGLLDSDFRAGCPVMAVAVEAGDPDPRTTAAVDRAAGAFQRWNSLIAQRLIADGVSVKKATDLAALVIAGLEGALVLARAGRDITPFDAVHRQLRSLLKSATEGNRNVG